MFVYVCMFYVGVLEKVPNSCLTIKTTQQILKLFKKKTKVLKDTHECIS